MQWVDDHIEWLIGLMFTFIGGIIAVVTMIGKAVYKERRNVLQRVSDVEKAVESHTGMITNLRTTLDNEVEAARNERQEIKESIVRVHERQDKILEAMSKLPMDIIAAQRSHQ